MNRSAVKLVVTTALATTGLASVTELSSAGSINASYSGANYTTPFGIAIVLAGICVVP
jgi:hypothetical protein